MFFTRNRCLVSSFKSSINSVCGDDVGSLKAYIRNFTLSGRICLAVVANCEMSRGS